jgi:hypothetical protein
VRGQARETSLLRIAAHQSPITLNTNVNRIGRDGAALNHGWTTAIQRAMRGLAPSHLVFDGTAAGNPLSMHDSDGMFPDDVPVADAVEQQRPTADSSSDEDYARPRQPDSDMPLEATASDWQEQQESVLVDPEFEEFDR